MKMLIDSDFKNWLLSILGQKLISVPATIYKYGDEIDFDEPQELNMVFERTTDGKLLTASDGCSLRWDNQSLQSVDMDEYGELIIMDISDFPIWQKLIGRMLRHIFFIVAPEQYLIGLRFEFENEGSVVVVNLGDELRVFESLPDVIIQEEEGKLEFIQITKN